MNKILITSAGGVNGVNVIQALRRQRELKLRLIATDAKFPVPAQFMADGFYKVPPAKDPSFVTSLLKICRKEHIEIVLPMYSAEILKLAKCKAVFDRAGVKMAIPSYRTVDITWNKEKTLAFFAAHQIPYPKTYSDKELDYKKAHLPLFFKTKSGSGSHEANILNSWDDVAYHRKRIKNYIIQDYIGGDEYTIDALGDLNGRMVAASPRIRLEVKGGLATKSITVRHHELVRYSKNIIEALRIVGPVNIQCKVERNKPYFIEINTRFPSGGLPLDVAAGFNIPLLVVKMLIGKPLGKIQIKENIVMLRYWDALFVEKQRSDYRFHGFYYEFE